MKYKTKALNYIKKVIGGDLYLRIRRLVARLIKFIRLKVFRKVYSILFPQQRTKKLDNFNVENVNGLLYPGNLCSFEELSPEIANDGLSIITLNLNGAKFLVDYIKGLSNLPLIPTQLIFVDHNSSDESVDILIKHTAQLNIEIKVIKKWGNDTYSKSNNDALEFAKYENILLLNNDVVITEFSQIHIALECLYSNETIGIIGWQLYLDSARLQPQHEGISFLWDHEYLFHRPINISGYKKEIKYGAVREFAAVTAAMALLRKKDLIQIGRFDENYNYGFEDVDICLAFSCFLNKKSVVIDGLSAVHVESSSQKRDNKLVVRKRRKKNALRLRYKFGSMLRALNRTDFLQNGSLYNLKRIKVGFVVTEAFDGATAGDYFTALEISIALVKQLNCEIVFFPQRGPYVNRQPSCKGVDLLLVMIDRFDLSNLQDRTADTVVVAWMRNWFDRWASWDYFKHYDYYLTSSNYSQDFMRSEYGINSDVLRLGTNFIRFHASCDQLVRDIDVCFVGSKWGVKREIESFFPVLNKFNSKIYGHGWNQEKDFQHLFQGTVDYQQVASIYSQSKIVIDDAASSTKKWGSINSRVYDALAAGCLVISNGHQGAKEMRQLDDASIDLPVFNNAQELESLLNKYLSNEQLRLSLCKRLQDSVRRHHSYDRRAATLINDLKSKIKKAYRIAIKVPVPDELVKHQWGDYHFAESLKLALMYMGHQVRIDIMPDWYDSQAKSDDVSIVLRGLSEYVPRQEQINIMWNISHPDKVSDSEFSAFDTVFVASKSMAKSIASRLPNANVLPLLQCTDPYRFFQEIDEDVPEHELLFVGNSRKIYRDVVKFSIDEGHPISVYGALWDGIIPMNYVKGQNIANTELRKYYSRAKVVLNDHWETMRANGFLSNRLFDAAACGSVVVSDDVDGLKEIFGNSVITFDGTSTDFNRAIELANNQKVTAGEIENVRVNHSFQARAKVIIDEVNRHALIKSQKHNINSF